jgi:large subunit ribosomal protein L30
MGKLRITWVKSSIGYAKDQKVTVRTLGLRRLNHTVEQDDNPAIRGMVRKVRHLVRVEEIDSPAATTEAPVGASTEVESSSGSATAPAREPAGSAFEPLPSSLTSASVPDGSR